VETVFMDLKRVLLLIVCAAVFTSNAWTGEPHSRQEEKKPAQLDRYGDPLPAGAVARLGTIRFRQRVDDTACSIAFTPDGQALAMTCCEEGNSGVCLLAVPGGAVLHQFELPPKTGLHEVAFSPDGKLLAARDRHRVFIWKRQGKRPIHVLSHEEEVHSFAFLPDGKTLATGCDRGFGSDVCAIRFWSLNTGRGTQRLEGHASSVSQLIVSPDGTELISCSHKEKGRQGKMEGLIPGRVCLWTLPTGKLIRQDNNDARWCDFSPDGRLLIVMPNETKYQVRERGTNKLLFEIPTDSIHFVFAPDGRTLAVTQQFKDMRLLDATTGKDIRAFPDSSSWGFSSARFSPNGKYLATSSESNGHAVVRLWDPTSGKELRQDEGHRDQVTAVALTPDGKTAVTGCRDGSIRLWDIGTSKEIRVDVSHKNAISALAVSQDGRLLASADQSAVVRLVELPTGKVLLRVHWKAAYRIGIGSLAFSSDGKTLLVGSTTNAARVVDVASGKTLQTVKGYRSLYHPVAFDPQGALVASCGVIDREPDPVIAVAIQDLRTGQEIWRIETERDDRPDLCESFDTLVFSPDSKILAAGRQVDSRHFTFGYELRAWEIATHKEVLRVKLPRSIHQLAFSPDGRVLLGSFSGWPGGDPALQLWDVGTGVSLGRVPGHISEVESLQYSRDGKFVITGSEDSTALIWDVRSFPRAGAKSPSPAELPTYWKALNGDDATSAHRAGWSMTLLPTETVAFLREQLIPVRPVSADELAHLIAALESKRFSEREKATAELTRHG
jgi:WD40 repeat protein